MPFDALVELVDVLARNTLVGDLLQVLVSLSKDCKQLTYHWQMGGCEL